MKKALVPLFVMATALAGCSPHIHLDFLGQEKLAEVVLLPGPESAKVLVVDVEGMISSTGEAGLLSREKNAVSRVYERLELAARDPRVRAVILRLDTPGGEVTASDILYHEVLRFKEKTRKPVVGLMMGLAASGGYYVASACDFILAHPTTLTGSIGVISIFPNFGELMAKIGVKVNVIKSGEAKDSGGPFRDMTGEEKKLFQAVIDEYYEDFLKAVSAGRGGRIAPAELRTMADGRVYTARQALDLKLVDGLGYFDDAFAKAISLAGIKAARLVAYTYHPLTKTNIYASRLGDFSPLDAKVLESYLAVLKTGFYYLWLPRSR
ncbi:MAG TPA: signal peptide peptidase SppA [Terriglobales bacterium]|nr:signal peptide peptidase SppA [Terriglobales bacterium]